MKLLPDAYFYWFIIGLFVFMAGGWTIYDAVRLRRFLRLPAQERGSDELFGYVMGIVMGLFGLGGTAKHLLGL